MIFVGAKDVGHPPSAVLDNDSLACFRFGGFTGLKVQCFELVGMRAVRQIGHFGVQEEGWVEGGGKFWKLWRAHWPM